MFGGGFEPGWGGARVWDSGGADTLSFAVKTTHTGGTKVVVEILPKGCDRLDIRVRSNSTVEAVFALRIYLLGVDFHTQIGEVHAVPRTSSHLHRQAQERLTTFRTRHA